MSKRTEAIRAMFTQPVTEKLSADNQPTEPQRRVAAGPVRAMQTTFSDIERENDALRARLGRRRPICRNRPDLIDPPPFADRFEQADDPAFTPLEQSIEERGQKFVLLRAHPSAPGRYQTAYGHRRVFEPPRSWGGPSGNGPRLSDDELVVAQGVENSREGSQLHRAQCLPSGSRKPAAPGW